MEDNEDRKKAAKKIIQSMKDISDDLIRKGVDIGKLREEMREELELMRAIKKAEKSTKH